MSWISQVGLLKASGRARAALKTDLEEGVAPKCWQI